MQNWLTELCGAVFMPHGQCYLWSPGLIWLHALSDSLIALAYFSIPFALLLLVRRRRDLPYARVFVMFGLFIVACGTTHLIEVWNIWHTNYVLAGLVKAGTALISLVTAVALFRALPFIQQLPGAAEWRRSQEQLEEHVRTRTADLAAANARLQAEIAQREQAEAEVRRLNAELERSVRELRTLFAVLPVGVGIANDPECRHIRTNPALATMLGLAREANASLTAAPEEAPHNFRVYHRGRQLAPDELPMQVAARENRPVIDFEETIERSDGVHLDVLANAIPLHDEQGRSTGCVCTLQDITPLKAAGEASARYAAILASSDDAIVGKTLGGIITTWNRGAEHLFGYAAAEMIGQHISRLFPADRMEEEQTIISRIATGEIVPQFETVRRHKDGRLLDVSITVSPILDAAGRIIGASKIARDITERKRLAREQQAMDRKLQESQKLESLGVLAGGIAHDFNNLLTGVLGNASMIRTELPPGSGVLPLVTQVETAARRAADLCRQLLAYSGRGRFVVQRLDLNQLVSETTHLLNLSISKHCVLRFNPAATLPPVSADATQIRQIVMNLVINASEAIGARSGIIALSTGVARLDAAYIATLYQSADVAHGDYAFIEVSDNGSGMDQATVARIFDPFFTTKFTGRGLGLAAVLGIIRGHKGAIKVYSEPGRGTTFKVLLPCTDGTAEPAGDDESAPPLGWRGQGTVLVVDDEETVRTISARMLERLGYSVVLAADGREAVEIYRASPARFTLVLMDLTMPHLDGEETFRQLRHLSPGVKVLLMSGFNQQEAVSRFTGKGLAGFLQKPFEAESLTIAVRQVLLAG